jgi:hypothetical protein
MFNGIRSFPAERELDVTQYKRDCVKKKCKQYENLYPEQYKVRQYLNYVCAKEKDFGKCFDNLSKKTIINRKITERNKCLKKKCSKQLWKRRTTKKR